MCTEDTYIDQGRTSDRCRPGDLKKNGILGISLWDLAGNVVVGTRRTTGELRRASTLSSRDPGSLPVIPNHSSLTYCNFDQLPLSTSIVSKAGMAGTTSWWALPVRSHLHGNQRERDGKFSTLVIFHLSSGPPCGPPSRSVAADNDAVFASRVL